MSGEGTTSERNGEAGSHIALLSDVGRVMSLLAGSPDVSAFLDRTVRTVATHMQAGVCSIYLFDEAAQELVLRATVGLNPDAVGTVRMGLAEGLVGKALRLMEVVCESRASSTPEFKHFPQANEDRFECFLAVPIFRGIEKVGVLVVQREEHRPFQDGEIAVMQILTSQLASAVENARALWALRRVDDGAAPAGTAGAPKAAAPAAVRFIGGRAVSGGWGLGPARWIGRRRAGDALRELATGGGGYGTAADLEVAAERTVEQLRVMQERIDRRLPEVAALVFDAHIMMLKDPSFLGKMIRLSGDGLAASAAVARTARHFIELFESSAHDYMREKARDVEDLALRLLGNMAGESHVEHSGLSGTVILATDLLPSDILAIASEAARGVVLAGGGATAHVILLARSMHIPFVLVGAAELAGIDEGALMLVDGDTGHVQASPSPAITAKYEQRDRDRERAKAVRGDIRAETLTRDGQRVHVMANINLLSELDLAVELKAEGVGLYRTEVPFLIRPSLPTEEDQVRVYNRLFSTMKGQSVTVRTLDAGGDKVLSYFDTAGEMNPALGLRSTRFSLAHPEIMDAQLRAMLRASAGLCRLRVMFPMIGSMDELREVRQRLWLCLAQVRAEGLAVEDPVVGVMIEVPAALEVMADLAAEVDFFSIGTNDFVQYLLAVDRTNPQVTSYYCEHHPAVLRTLARAVRTARESGKDLGICGEMAHEPRYIPFLMGIGIRRLSVDPGFIPLVREVISRWSVPDAVALAGRMLAASSTSQIEALLPVS